MGVWIVVSLVAFVGLVVTIVALFAPRAEPQTEPRRPLWLLPHPREVLRPGFRRSLYGYDPAEVDAHLEAVAIAYAALRDAAGDEAVELAGQEIARRLGRPPPDADVAAEVKEEPPGEGPDEPRAEEPGPVPDPEQPSDPEPDGDLS